MIRTVCLTVAFTFLLAASAAAQGTFPVDVVKTSGGDLKITFIGHASLMFEYNGKVLYVDPWTKQADYNKLPKADLILITHEHQDHLDPAAVKAIRTDRTVLVYSEKAEPSIPGGTVMKNGDKITAAGFPIEAVPAYNIVHKRDSGEPYHPKGVGNGYVITFGDKRVYVAGDTENIPEMKAIENIELAFLPMNLPYTMTPEMVADAAKVFWPKILFPYHYGQTDLNRIVELMKDAPDVQVWIRTKQ